MSCPECHSVKVIELKNEDFIDGIDNPTRKCEKCNFTWNNYEMSNVDNFVIGFCRKAMKVLSCTQLYHNANKRINCDS